jgi:hypothetical protein
LTHLHPNFVVKVEHREKPVSGVRVDITDKGGSIVASLVSDSNGEARFSNIPPGTYSIGGDYLQGIDVSVNEAESEDQPIDRFSLIWMSDAIVSNTLLGKIEVPTPDPKWQPPAKFKDAPRLLYLISPKVLVPLSGGAVEVWDVASTRKIDQTLTDSRGSFWLATPSSGFYRLKIIPDQNDEKFKSDAGEVLVEISQDTAENKIDLKGSDVCGFHYELTHASSN